MEEFSMISHDGLYLAGYHWPLKSNRSPYALIVLIHGLAEHSGRYEPLIQFYTHNDFPVISMDLRGHGQSAGRSVFVPTAEAMFKDIDLLLKEARRRYPFCPIVLYGHSMGGSLALSYTLKRFPTRTTPCSFQAIIATSPWIRLARPYQPPAPIFSLFRTACRVRPSMRVRLRFDPEIITRDREVIDSYTRDTYVRRSATLSLVRHIGGLARKLDRRQCRFPIPVLIQHGDADSITSHQASRRFCQRGENIQFKTWPQCYHQLHSEPEKEEIFQFTIEWIRKTIRVTYL